MKSSKSSLFLMELIIAILFFSLASAACIQLFVKAHLLDRQTNEQNQTAIWSQNLAELWYAKAGDLDAVRAQLSADNPSDTEISLSTDESELSLYLDSRFHLSTSADSVYSIHLTNSGYDESTLLYSAQVTFENESGILFTLPLVYHPSLERGPSHE